MARGSEARAHDGGEAARTRAGKRAAGGAPASARRKGRAYQITVIMDRDLKLWLAREAAERKFDPESYPSGHRDMSSVLEDAVSEFYDTVGTEGDPGVRRRQRTESEQQSGFKVSRDTYQILQDLSARASKAAGFRIFIVDVIDAALRRKVDDDKLATPL